MDLREIKEFLRDTGIYLITLAIIVFILIFVISFQPIAGNSMYPNLEDGNVVLISRMANLFWQPKRNEIAIIKIDNKSYVKRIIGLPGEDIKYIENVLYINDEPVSEDFLGEGIVTGNFTLDNICKKNECPNGVIPDGKYLVLGDNRPKSEDSRSQSFGLIDKNGFKGKIFFRVWPLNKIGGVR